MEAYRMSYGHSAERYCRELLAELLREVNDQERAHYRWALKLSLTEPDNDPTSWHNHFKMQAKLTRQAADDAWEALTAAGVTRPEDAHEGCVRLTLEQEATWLDANL